MSITNAKNKKLNEAVSGLPDLSGAVECFLQDARVGLVTKKQVSGYTQETIDWICTRAVRQVMRPQELVVKPEGQRAWRWFKIHAVPECVFKVDDIIIMQGVRMRIMEKVVVS